MKYITSCPKCDTHFLLNDELIAAHHGKVQCGTCEHVFNAKTRLTEVADSINSADEYQASLEGSVETTPESANIDLVDEDLFADEFANVKVKPDPTFELGGATNLEGSQTKTGNEPSIFDDLNQNTKATKKKTKHPFLLALFSLLLILLAATQAIYHMRVDIAAQYPQFKPLLLKACVHLHCSVGLPKDLDSITIGDSDMQESDQYTSVINFTSSLTNTVNYPLTYPNIALTLTDENDNIVIKKLILPADYIPAEKKVEDGLAGRSVNTIKLQIYVHEAAVAGYRILLVYP